MPNKNPTVKEIVKEYLEKNGFDGLYGEEDECACFLGDLMTCCGEGDIVDCKAGYKTILPEDSDYPGEPGIGPEKEGK